MANPQPEGFGRVDLPTGTVTFLLTDIESSTRLWETVPDAMEEALERHNRLVTGVIEAYGGVVVTSRGEGDSFFACFGSAVSAVDAAGDCQRRLTAEAWPAAAALRVRMGLHTGEAHIRDGDYVEHASINRCARVKAAAHGGQVLITQTTRDLVDGRLGGGLGLRRLGKFRLRDLSEPELLYQLTHADLPADFAPPDTAHVGNIPLQVTSFVGRAGELRAVARALDRSRLVTLTGVGGVGKTRLALEAAGQVLPRFTDGGWLCELAPIRDVAGVDDAVAAALSVTARAGQSTREALVDFLRSRDLLLVLDNCEHLLDGAAALAGALARSCERLVILSTSRQGLGIDGERLVPVPPLEVPGADADLAAIAEAGAVRLFADRATAVKPGFAVSAENAAAVAAVVRRLDGIALAIELAAARVPAMTPAELARRLERSVALLAGGRRGEVAHHQTLRATIDWSFQLLTEPEQRMLCRLAVFAGGATMEAVEEVCGGQGIDPVSVFELLANLVAQSLLVAEDHGPVTRYRLLETIRQYGEKRLDDGGEIERWRARHADYYAGLLPRIRGQAHDSQAEVFWAVRVSVEQDNLLAAWSWAIGTGNVDVAFSILAGFAPSEVWHTYPLLLDGEAALRLPDAVQHPGYPLALAVSALFASNRADVRAAEELAGRATDASTHLQTPDWRVQEAICATRQNVAITTGAFADAARLAEHAAGIARAAGDLADTSVQLTMAVACYVLAGDAPSAVPLANEALALARLLRAPALIASALLEVGASVVRTDPEHARACLRESRELTATLGYESALDLVWATGIASLLPDRTSTLELGRRALLGLQRSGDRLRMGITLHMLAGALAATKPEAAAIILGAAEAHVIESPETAQLILSAVAASLGEERARELHARGADTDWDRAVAYTLTQTGRALEEIPSESQP
jgi:predicted ATPase/class 3 adenylate cyclase